MAGKLFLPGNVIIKVRYAEFFIMVKGKEGFLNCRVIRLNPSGRPGLKSFKGIFYDKSK
jgi:hypothetical protein